jgi:hypothetical protein
MARFRAFAMADCQLTTLPGCELVIGRYPPFLYNAGGGQALGSSHAATDGELLLQFSTEHTAIPPLNGSTTRFLGLPLPPGLSVAIHPMALGGRFVNATGELELRFRARFRFRAGLAHGLSITAPDLEVNTLLTTETIQSRRHQRQGRRLQASQPGLLVGAALIEPTGEAWLDRFLGLPNEALAVLHCQLTVEDRDLA